MNYKNIHIGQMIKARITECEIESERICNFMNSTDREIEETLKQENVSTEELLKWSKLLEYDFFRLYSQHLIFYAPPSAEHNKKKENVSKGELPTFRKNIYTKEIIDFILEQVSSGEMTKTQVMEKYKIPKTTLYKWISKYN